MMQKQKHGWEKVIMKAVQISTIVLYYNCKGFYLIVTEILEFTYQTLTTSVTLQVLYFLHIDAKEEVLRKDGDLETDTVSVSLVLWNPVHVCFKSF